MALATAAATHSTNYSCQRRHCTVSVIVSQPYSLTTTTSCWTGSTFSTTTIFPAAGGATGVCPGQTTTPVRGLELGFSTTTLLVVTGGVLTVQVFSPDPRVIQPLFMHRHRRCHNQLPWPTVSPTQLVIACASHTVSPLTTSYWTGTPFPQRRFSGRWGATDN